MLPFWIDLSALPLFELLPIVLVTLVRLSLPTAGLR